MSAREIKSPKQFYFADVQALQSDRARAAEGMRVASTEVARFLVSQLTVLGTKAASRYADGRFGRRTLRGLRARCHFVVHACCRLTSHYYFIRRPLSVTIVTRRKV
ncbi:MAG TPA: hypothetical protein VF861_09895 [Telluria sp.]